MNVIGVDVQWNVVGVTKIPLLNGVLVRVHLYDILRYRDSTNAAFDILG